MTNICRLLGAVAVASVAAFGLARAQAPTPGAAPQAPAIPEYKVEIILFAYRDFNRGEERFDHRIGNDLAEPLELRPPPVFDDSTLESLDESDGSTPVEPFDDGTGFRFRLLAPEELTLTREYAALGRINAYVPLVHGGWVQQGLPESEAHPFDLSLLGVRNPRGSVRLHLSRFLHLKVGLTYQDGGGPVPQATFGDPLAELPLAPSYTLHADRQVPRSGELHYFDHPAFGLLVLVSPLPPDAAPVVPRVQPAA